MSENLMGKLGEGLFFNSNSPPYDKKNENQITNELFKMILDKVKTFSFSPQDISIKKVEILLKLARESSDKERILYDNMGIAYNPEWINELEAVIKNPNSISGFNGFKGINANFFYKYLYEKQEANRLQEIIDFVNSPDFAKKITSGMGISYSKKAQGLKEFNKDGKPTLSTLSAFQTMSKKIQKTQRSIGSSNKDNREKVIDSALREMLDSAIIGFMLTTVEGLKNITEDLGLESLTLFQTATDTKALSDEELESILWHFFADQVNKYMKSSEQKRSSYLIYAIGKGDTLSIEKDLDKITKIDKAFETILQGNILNLYFLKNDKRYVLSITLKKSSCVEITTNYKENQNSSIDDSFFASNMNDFVEKILSAMQPYVSSEAQSSLESLKTPLITVLSRHKEESISFQEYGLALFGNQTTNIDYRKATIQGSFGEMFSAAIIQEKLNINSNLSNEVEILGQDLNEKSQQAHVDVLVKIGGEKIGIQAKQFNANSLFQIEHLYKGAYNVFEESIQRYVEDKNFVKYLRYAAYHLTNGTNDKITDYDFLNASFQNFSRIFDSAAAANLRGVANNFYLYNLNLIPLSMILCNIALGILSETSSRQWFSLERPYFELKTGKEKSKKEKEEQLAGEKEDEEEYLTEVYFDEGNLVTKYKKNNSNYLFNIKGNLNFVGLTIDIKKYIQK